MALVWLVERLRGGEPARVTRKLSQMSFAKFGRELIGPIEGVRNGRMGDANSVGLESVASPRRWLRLRRT
jgi:hypothetical protein